MKDTTGRILWVILLVALALRVGFVLRLPPAALYWDEPTYDAWAADYREAWSSSLGGTNGPTLAEAFRASLQKGEAYAVTVALVYSLCGREPRAVFVLQALLDTLTCLFLFGLARAVAGAGAGLVAAAVAALYEPFVFSAARLQTETFTSFLYVGALWAICVPQRRRSAAAVCAGVLIAAAMLARPALQWLFLALLPAILVRNSERAWRVRATLALAFAAGFFVVIGPRLALTAAMTGRPIWAGTLDPGVDMYAGAVVENAGWKTDRLAFATPPRGELLAVLGDPPARRWQEADMRAAAIRTWVRHPAASAAVLLHKLYEAWLHPYNDSRWTFLSGERGPAVFHRIVLVLGLLGMPLALQRWRAGVPLVATALYLWLTVLVVKIEVRYAVIAMPMMICFAAVAVATLRKGWESAWQSGGRRVPILLAAAAALGLVAARWLTIAQLLQIVPLTANAADGVRVALLLAAIVLGAIAAAQLTAHLWSRSTTLSAFAPAVATAGLIVLFGRPLAHCGREWRSTLTANGAVARREIVLPPALAGPRSAALKLDLLPEGPGGYDVVVRLNGKEIKRYRGGLTRGDADLPTQNYYRQIFTARRRTTKPDRAWYEIGVPPDLISPGATMTVDVRLEGAEKHGGSVALFGDYPSDASIYTGPSLFSPAINADTSIYKYLAEDDFRMRRSISLSAPSRSRFHHGDAWSDDDLALDPGRQLGRYRIFLLLVYDRGTAVL